MSDVALRVDRLGKQYKIGLRQQRNTYKTLREAVTNAVVHRPIHYIRGEKADRRNEIIWALRDVSFEIKQGEVVGVIGRNGAGKSTVLKILSRITEPTEGYAEIRGRIGSLLEVGTGFHPELTGRENIYLNGAILGMKKAEIERRFDEIVAFSEVERFIDTPVKHYSSGMRIRLAFAVAAHLETENLLVDEVLAVGDVAFQQKCLSKMGEVTKEGRTVLFVSHNMSAIAALTRRSLWLDDGRLIANGCTQDVIESYLTKISSALDLTGFVSLATLPRAESLPINPLARLEWVRTRNKDGRQTSVFTEREPIIVEFGFKVFGEIGNLELGVGVLSVQRNVELFFAPSPVYRLSLSEGCYRIRMSMDPNYLQAGAYSLILKMFADGVRQETLGDALRFTITGNGLYREKDGRFKGWISGPLRFDYEWGKVELGATAAHE